LTQPAAQTTANVNVDGNAANTWMQIDDWYLGMLTPRLRSTCKAIADQLAKQLPWKCCIIPSEGMFQFGLTVSHILCWGPYAMAPKSPQALHPSTLIQMLGCNSSKATAYQLGMTILM
jgi:hypothetical protein